MGECEAWTGAGKLLLGEAWEGEEEENVDVDEAEEDRDKGEEDEGEGDKGEECSWDALEVSVA